jgi:hypothetical protein
MIRLKLPRDVALATPWRVLAVVIGGAAGIVGALAALP